MKYNPILYHRRSIRLKGYNYSKAGLYFITICVQNRECLFGNVINDKTILNDAGQMVVKWYYELENKYPDKKCHEMIVMPNHFHCIIENVTGVPIMDVHVVDALLTTNVYNKPTTSPPTNTAQTTKNTMPPLAMQWIGLKQ